MLVAVLGRAALDGVEIRSQRQRRLLAALVLHRQSFVTSDRLAEMVWGASQPNDPVGALHTLLSRLRSNLDQRVAISSSNSAYRLIAPRGTLDVDVVSAWRFASESVADEERLHVLDHALSLFRGEPFADLDDVDAFATQEQFREMRIAISEARASCLSQLGRHDEAIASLRFIVAERPDRESTVVQLMAALYTAGHQVAALAAAAELRRHLREEFGIDPSPEVTEFELAVLRHEVGGATRSDTSVIERPNSVRLPITPFVGRDTEVEEIRALTDSCRLITLLGPGGIGKTRLAMELAAEIQGAGRNVHVVELADIEDGDRLLSAIAGRVGAAQSATVSLEDAVVGRLDAAPTLLVLDNCEHIRGAVASVAAGLLASTRRLTVVATSREPLRVSGEQRWMVPALHIDHAVALFLDRARRIDRRFDAVSSDVRVIELCDRLDRLPLALELAASALSGQGLGPLLEQLEDPLTVLVSDDRALPPRHRSITATLEWSYSRLDSAEQHAFDRLGVFAGAFSADDVRHLVGEQSARMLPRLVERSMVTMRDLAGGSTYEMLDTMRSYARTQRGTALDIDRAHHADWILAAAVDASQRLMGPKESASFRWYRQNMANFRQAHQWFVAHDDHENRIRLTDSLIMWAWQHRQAEVLGWAESLSTEAHTEEPRLDAIRVGLSTMALSRTRFADVQLAEGSTTAVGLVSHHAAALAHYAATDICMFVGRYDLAAQHAQQALDHATAGADSVDTVQLAFFATNGAAFANYYLGNMAEAERWSTRAEQLAAQHDSRVAHAWVALARGEGFATRQPDRAKLHTERCLALVDPLEHIAVNEMALYLLNFIDTQLGEPRAIERLCRYVERLDATSTWHELTTALCVAAETLATLGRVEDATRVVAAVTARSVDPIAIAQRSERLLGHARSTLLDGTFETAWAEGSTWTLTDAAHVTVRGLRSHVGGSSN